MVVLTYLELGRTDVPYNMYAYTYAPRNFGRKIGTGTYQNEQAVEATVPHVVLTGSGTPHVPVVPHTFCKQS